MSNKDFMERIGRELKAYELVDAIMDDSEPDNGVTEMEWELARQLIKSKVKELLNEKEKGK